MKNCSKEEFFSPVRKEASQLLFPSMEFSPHNSHCVIVTRPDEKDQVVNFVSDRYGLLHNSEFFGNLEDRLRQNKFRFDGQYSHVDFCKYYADYTIQGRDLMIGSTKYQDKIMPRMKIMRSYSSQIGFRVVYGFYRQICSNGMWGTKWVQQANLKHTEGNLDKMYQVITEGMQKFLDETQQCIEEFQVVGDRSVTHWVDRIEEVIASTAFSVKLKEDVIRRVNIEHNENNLPITDWLIYNAFNYQLNHSDQIHSSPEARIQLDREIFKHIIDNPFDAKFEPELISA